MRHKHFIGGSIRSDKNSYHVFKENSLFYEYVTMEIETIRQFNRCDGAKVPLNSVLLDILLFNAVCEALL